MLRRLDTREHTWQLAAQALLEAGDTPAEAIRHLAAHAPPPKRSPPACTTSNSTFTRRSPSPSARPADPDLVALSERFGLSPTETAQTLAVACASPTVLANVVADRCDGDLDATVAACATVLQPDAVERALHDKPVVTALAVFGLGIDEADQLDQLRAALGDPDHRAAVSGIDSDHGLLVALDTFVHHRDDHQPGEGPDVSENATVTLPPQSDSGGVLLDVVAATDYLSSTHRLGFTGWEAVEEDTAMVGHRPPYPARRPPRRRLQRPAMGRRPRPTTHRGRTPSRLHQRRRRARRPRDGCHPHRSPRHVGATHGPTCTTPATASPTPPPAWLAVPLRHPR